ncbi:unnamed protein product [Periconia digitata]|uniref:Uncharacterized protein n=1 Tax=Periconia digitata TaxID=1303443 RepID=A0A9W4XVB4_9PLEO|nr:unnamed protein product [Periconia digitata]
MYVVMQLNMLVWMKHACHGRMVSSGYNGRCMHTKVRMLYYHGCCADDRVGELPDEYAIHGGKLPVTYPSTCCD